MKLSPGLALIALFPLGCGGATSAASGSSDLALTQRPAEVTVVDLRPADPPAPKAPEKPKETDAATLAKEAEGLGILGVLNTGAGSDPNAPTTPWGNGSDGSLSGPVNMWGENPGTFGAGGLGLSGVSGGGGTGIGTLGIGTLGHGSGVGTGQNNSSPQTSVPRIKLDKPTATAGLPPEIIQRFVRQSYSRFRFCYERGLISNPKLAGKIVVRFTIDKTGAVSSASLVKDTTLPDMSVAACVVTSFTSLSFPQPTAGASVNVVYPLQLFPPDPPAAPATAAPAAPAKPAVAPATPKSP